MPNLKIQPVYVISVLALILLTNSGAVHAIAKCQDENGKWHYGDSAAAACGTKIITIINDSGRKIDEIGEPMTIEEINAIEAEEKRKKLEEKQQARRAMEKNRILAIYPSEDSLIRARDDRLKGMDKNLGLQEKLLQTMRLDLKALKARPVPAEDGAKKKLDRRVKEKQDNLDNYYTAITQLRREREQTAEKYEKILLEFRELTAE